MEFSVISWCLCKAIYLWHLKKLETEKILNYCQIGGNESEAEAVIKSPYLVFYFGKRILKMPASASWLLHFPFLRSSLSLVFSVSNYFSLVVCVKTLSFISCSLFYLCGEGKEKLIRWVTHPENITMIWIRAKASLKYTFSCSFKHLNVCSLLDTCKYVNVCDICIKAVEICILLYIHLHKYDDGIIIAGFQYLKGT